MRGSDHWTNTKVKYCARSCITQATNVYDEGEERGRGKDIRCVMEDGGHQCSLWFGGKLDSHVSVAACRCYSVGRGLHLFNFRFGIQPEACSFVLWFINSYILSWLKMEIVVVRKWSRNVRESGRKWCGQSGPWVWINTDRWLGPCDATVGDERGISLSWLWSCSSWLCMMLQATKLSLFYGNCSIWVVNAVL